jgi:DNA-directed RNA polymerase II subunit RPB2
MIPEINIWMNWYYRERDVIIAHGASRFLKERLFEKSDAYIAYICDNCGNTATTPTECKFCDSYNISKVGMPFASTLLFKELMAMNIKIKFETE